MGRSIPLELLLSGLTLGVGPCSFFCLLILLPYVAGTWEGLMEGLKASLSFALSRQSAYTLLGLVAGLSGEYMISLLGWTEFSLYVWILGGSFVSLLGVLMLLGRNTDVAQLPFLMRHTLDSSLKSMGLLGFIVSITPCAPLLGILTYITFSAKTPPDRSLR